MTDEVLKAAFDYENPDGRRWLYAGCADSYNEESNRVSFWVLEGTPPRGFIIIWHGDFPHTYVTHAARLDRCGKLLMVFHAAVVEP